jgi:hypothetical protein
MRLDVTLRFIRDGSADTVNSPLDKPVQAIQTAYSWVTSEAYRTASSAGGGGQPLFSWCELGPRGKGEMGVLAALLVSLQTDLELGLVPAPSMAQRLGAYGGTEESAPCRGLLESLLTREYGMYKERFQP